TRKADIKLQTGAGFKLIDVTIVSPTSGKAQRQGSRESPDVAAKLAETRKRTEYKTSLDEAGIRSQDYIPFAVESSGRFGPVARKFFDSLEKLPGLRQNVECSPGVELQSCCIIVLSCILRMCSM